MPQIKIIMQILGEIPDDIRRLKVQENDIWGKRPEHLIMKVKKHIAETPVSSTDLIDEIKMQQHPVYSEV